MHGDNITTAVADWSPAVSRFGVGVVEESRLRGLVLKSEDRTASRLERISQRPRQRKAKNHHVRPAAQEVALQTDRRQLRRIEFQDRQVILAADCNERR